MWLTPLSIFRRSRLGDSFRELEKRTEAADALGRVSGGRPGGSHTAASVYSGRSWIRGPGDAGARCSSSVAQYACQTWKTSRPRGGCGDGCVGAAGFVVVAWGAGSRGGRVWRGVSSDVGSLGQLAGVLACPGSVCNLCQDAAAALQPPTLVTVLCCLFCRHETSPAHAPAIVLLHLVLTAAVASLYLCPTVR